MTTVTDPAPLPAATDTATLAAAVRLALRRMAKSVTVITCLHEGRRYAMAATAADALSMDPPSMIVSVNRSASLHAPLSAGADFCINVLGRVHEPVSRACGGGLSGEDRFTVGDWITGPGGVPMLVDAQASFVCHNDISLSYGTHGIFVGRLVDVRSTGDVDPLVYLDGRYTRIAD